MKVLQLIDTLEAGGAERVAVNYANGLINQVEASFLCATRAEGVLKENLKEDVGYLFLNRTKTIDFRATDRLSRFIKENNIDVLHAHASSFFLATLIRLLHPKLKLVWHDHYGQSEFLKQRPKLILKLCSLFFSHIFSVNMLLEAWANKALKAKSVSYLPNYAKVYDTTLKTRLKGDEGQRIVCLANLRPQKDHLTLIKAYKIVNTNYPDWTLHLVGKAFNDTYFSSIKASVKLAAIKDKVFFYGSCSDSSAILKACDIGVLSSMSEGLPLALLEYGLADLPVVSTNVGQCSTVIEDKVTGLILPAKDYKGFAKAIMTYIEDVDIRVMYSRALTLSVENTFSEAATFKKIIKTYKGLND